MKTWPALELRFPPTLASSDLQDRLLVLLDDLRPSAINEGSRPPEEENAPPDVWIVHFDAASSRDRALGAITDAFGPNGLAARPVDVQDENWVERSQALLAALRIGWIVVAPPWNVPERPDGHVVVIRPSTGFGTGHHPSTRLCLKAMQRLDVAGRSVLDVGTGSGVLAIAAVRLGAARTVAVDWDPDALANARENAQTNRVGEQLALHVVDLGDIDRLGLPAFDLVLANLTAGVLQRQADRLRDLTAAGGSLIVSGILADQVRSVIAAFRREPRQAMSVHWIDREDVWQAVTFGRSGARLEAQGPRRKARG